MKVIWSPAVRYRCFLAPSRQVATIVSTNLTNKAVGRLVPNGLTLVTNARGLFCDLEMALIPENRVLEDVTPNESRNAIEPLETILDTGSSAKWFLNEPEGQFVVTLSDERVESWFELIPGKLFIGTRRHAILGAVAVEGFIKDPTGRREAVWLDELEISAD